MIADFLQIGGHFWKNIVLPIYVESDPTLADMSIANASASKFNSSLITNKADKHFFRSNFFQIMLAGANEIPTIGG